MPAILLALLLIQPAADLDPDAAADALREGLAEAYAAGDIAAMGRYLHREAVLIFPDGEVLVGVDGLADYHARMTAGDDPVVASFQSNPTVERRVIHGDAVVSQGRMNDEYVLADGTGLALDSVFTATLVRLPDGPPETDGYMIRSFHASTDAFDNDVLDLAVNRSGTYAGAIAGLIGALIGLVLGGLAGALLARRRASAR